MSRLHDERGTLDRRSFVKASLAPSVLSIPAALGMRQARGEPDPAHSPVLDPEIIDTNIHLFSWPFRRLKYDRTDILVRKLRRHRIAQAWAGSFEAVLHKQLDAVNRRLVEETRTHGDHRVLPIGSVNPVWPDWDEDLRRCHEAYRMRGIRLYPAYHGYTLDHSEVARLLDAAARRGLFVQVVIRMEDERVHHPSLVAPVVDAAPLLDLLPRIPEVRLQLLNADTVFRSGRIASLIERSNIVFDIAAVEGNGGIARLIDGGHPTYRGRVPLDRLLFGSHAPFFPCESAMWKLFESPLDLQRLDAIMHANARRFLG